MGKAVLWQFTTTLVVASVAAALGGFHAAVSAALGGLACVVPNALFALRLAIEMRRPGGASVHGFFIGEFAKLAATVGFLFVVAWTYHGLHWLALIVGFIAALKSYFLMFVFDRNHA